MDLSEVITKIEVLPVTPAIIGCDASSTSGLPLLPLQCLRFYATIASKWGIYLKIGKYRRDGHESAEESLRIFRHCVDIEYECPKQVLQLKNGLQ